MIELRHSVYVELDKMTKAQLIERRDAILAGKTKTKESEGIKLAHIRLINEKIGSIQVGRPRKANQDKSNTQIKINVTKSEADELKHRSKKLGYKHLSTYMKHVTINLTPDLRVEEIVISEEEEEMIEDINHGIQLITAQLSYTMLEDKISKDDALAILTQISAVQQKMAEREQRQLGQYNEGFALTIANKYLSAEQLQKMADFKHLREEDQASILH
ncbi:hypothetical protein BCT62_03770 [Vibrio splendidus]|uniref:hypothetical protein n=1 Tax=Vibrio splendidus TaxID=29497 RepID=UPI000C821EA1|nr:hypothetical protein [Vibrio splendidus]PMM18492.1 hypothetical protein BCT62_03770 [Vibrio splendidus]